MSGVVGVVGDPYILRADGSKYTFSGAPGSTYLYAADSSVKVAFRVASVPGGTAGNQLVDRVVVQVESSGLVHTAVIDLTSATVDKVPLVFSGPSIPFAGTGTARYWTGAAGEIRVDLVYGAWHVAVIQDPGTCAALHYPGPLWQVPHLGLFLDSLPAGNTLVGGVYLASGPGVAVAPFLIEV